MDELVVVVRGVGEREREREREREKGGTVSFGNKVKEKRPHSERGNERRGDRTRGREREKKKGMKVGKLLLAKLIVTGCKSEGEEEYVTCIRQETRAADYVPEDE